MSGHGGTIAPARTCGHYAHEQWTREHWGLPLNESYRRLWSLFWTNSEPEEPYTPRYWSRPPLWVELLVRYGPPPAVSAVTQHEQP